MTNVVIVSAGRTAVGSFNGSFANTAAHDLGAAVIDGVVTRAGIDKADV
ncbi:MAG: acetyl-CoA C-acetyltransferase, partial [Albidovulum sp.]